MTILDSIRSDLRANSGNYKAQLILVLFRISHLAYLLQKERRACWQLFFPCRIFYRLLVEWLLGVELQDGTTAGPGLQLFHAQALVVHGATILGYGCILRQCTTIGCVRMSDGSLGPSPVLGDNVEVGANCVILGGIFIGNGARIGAGSVVIHDVPEDAVVVGNPAHIIHSRKQAEAFMEVPPQ